MQRAGARKLLIVHKAAQGSLKHADEAAAAVADAAKLLDDHHGSASGLASVGCMAPPAKGKSYGKGKYQAGAKESWEARRDRLIAEESELAKQQSAAANRLQNLYTQGDKSASGGRAKGGAKGTPGNFGRSNQANLRVQSTQAELDAAADRAYSAAAKRAEAREGNRVSNAERNRLKKEERDQSRLDAGPRPTRFCTKCTYAGTYETSARCHACKVCFEDPKVPTPTPTPAPTPAAAPSAAELAAVSTLAKIKEESAARIATYAGAVKAGGPVVVPPPPAPPQPKAAAAPPPAPTVAVGANAPPSVDAAASAATAAAATADLEEAKQITALRAKRAKAEAQRTVFEDVPEVHASFTRMIAQLDQEVTDRLAERQKALPPHQLGAVVAQRQLELCTAQKEATDVKAAVEAEGAAFDTKAKSIDAGYAEELRKLQEAQVAARAGFDAQRIELHKRLAKRLADATAASLAARQLLQTAEAAHASQSGATKLAADAAAEVAAQVTAAAAAALAEQQRAATTAADAQQVLQAQIDAQKILLAQQEQKIQDQHRLLQPSAVKAPVQLPTPAAPTDTATGDAWFRLRQFLILLAQQEAPVGVSWNDLVQFLMTWEEFSKLVPFHVSKESIPDLDAAAGPHLDQHVPRRLLACLRDQMDVLVHEWFKEAAKSDARAELTTEANKFAQTVLDEAKRIQEKKRPAEMALSDLKTQSDGSSQEITAGQHTQITQP